MNDLRHDPDTVDGPAPAVLVPVYLDGPPVINPVAERTAYLRQWQQVPPGVQPWGRTVMHHDGATWTNVDPLTPDAPDLRTVGEKVAELTEAVTALEDDSGHTAHKLRELAARVAHVERLLHKAMNPGEQETTE